MCRRLVRWYQIGCNGGWDSRPEIPEGLASREQSCLAESEKVGVVALDDGVNETED